MTFKSSLILRFAPVAVVFSGLTSAFAAAKPTARQILDQVEKEAAARPAQVAEVVSKNVEDYPEYACPIIKAAMKGAGAGRSEEPELISAALAAAPEKGAEIKACLQGSGKEPISQAGKDPVGTVPTTENFISDDFASGRTNAVTGATYFASPGGGGGAANPSTSAPETKTITKVVRITRNVGRVAGGGTTVPATESTPTTGAGLEITDVGAGTLTLAGGHGAGLSSETILSGGALNLSLGHLNISSGSVVGNVGGTASGGNTQTIPITIVPTTLTVPPGASPGTISGSGAVWTNSGNLIITGGGRINSGDPIGNQGTLHLSGGSLMLSGPRVP